MLRLSTPNIEKRFHLSKMTVDRLAVKHTGIPAITGPIDHSKAYHVFPHAWQLSINAYGALIVSTFIGFPLDTVKTRMQTHKHFKGYLDCVRQTFAADGFRGFFRGIWAPLISTSFSKSFSVSIFALVKPVVYTAIYSNSPVPTLKDGLTLGHPFLRNIPVCFISGTIAGGGVSLFACPFEFIKIYAQLESLINSKIVKNSNASSTWKIATRIVQYDGLGGLYSGFRYHFLRDTLSSGIYFSIYESMKYAMNVAINKNGQTSSPISVMLAGGFSGVSSWLLIFPVDTCKSLIQKDMVGNILREQQGLEKLALVRRVPKFERRAYRGLGVSMSRSFLVNMVFFSVFEGAMKKFA